LRNTRPPETVGNGYRHIAFDEIESTNLIAMEYARNADPGKLWITAEKQSQGKGSRGRSWVSQPGNLYASLLLCIDSAPEKLTNLTFVASLATYETLAQFIPEGQLALKWPNDVLLKQAKVSGILLENHIRKEKESAIIIGIGINCQSNPDNTNTPATNLANSGYAVEPQSVFHHLVSQMDAWLALWNEGANFGEIREEWLARAVGLGQEIRVTMPHKELRGIFEELDQNGCLILRTPDNLRHTISTADIFLTPFNNKAHKDHE
jgi:BirA family biotin operon repressor/biotin-[acetyl-CoA-carboxylase] ligase